LQSLPGHDDVGHGEMMGLEDRIPSSVQGKDYSAGILRDDYSLQPKPLSALYLNEERNLEALIDYRL
jgi:hypothetical protein